MPTTTTRGALRKAALSDAADASVAVGNLADDADSKILFWYPQDILANRPAAGHAGFAFWATDSKVLYYDDGTVWRPLGVQSLVDVFANLPAANSLPKGSTFFATDKIVDLVTDGTNWLRKGLPAGSTQIQLGAAADTGWILLQGQAWPATTGIYAELFAKLGGANLPDFRTYTPGGFKTGDANFGTLLNHIGEVSHTLSISEIPAHNHPPLNGGSWTFRTDINPNIGTGGGGEVGSGNGITAVGNDATTGNAGGGAAHNTIQPTVVVNFQAKL